MLRQLTYDEYHATMTPPMTRLGEDDPISSFSLKPYVKQCISALSLPTTWRAIEIHHVYRSADRVHAHVLFWFGRPNVYLVLVLDEASHTIVGHLLLDLNERYGLVPHGSS